jgi:hypothetical protein
MGTTRIRTTVTPLYPGSFFPEEGNSVEIPFSDQLTALAAVKDDGHWFALEVSTKTQKLWTDGDGGELWRQVGDSLGYRIYVGEVLSVSDIENMEDTALYSILLSNMRGNGWERVVRTRLGNFQPLEPDDVVVDPADLVC